MIFSINCPYTGTKKNRVEFYWLDLIEKQGRGGKRVVPRSSGILIYDQDEKGNKLPYFYHL